ncbi:TetR/AcrR family transcriptional regulator [Pseudonocardia acaciae]|uniref:TetR/AcrR family transcriptional regulator n=1 Tax=Pseudonocardia acaciae TaxID=551276 RepID=UPI000566B294|nr:TetR/AcrR family transcriptional regulator [Pseudonocardia acaciae]
MVTSAPEPVSRRARPAKPPLTRAGIVAAAIEVLDSEGLDGVTMRRLARALDTAAGSLYVYFDNRDELLAAAYDRVLGELALPDPDPETAGDWRAELTDLLLDAITVIGRHGGIARVALGAIPTGPNALALTEVVLGLLARGEVEEQAAAWAVDQLMLYVNAAALEDSTYRRRGAREPTEVASLRATYAALPAEQYPNTYRMRAAMTTGSGDQRARWFVETVLTGIVDSGGRGG